MSTVLWVQSNPEQNIERVDLPGRREEAMIPWSEASRIAKKVVRVFYLGSGLRRFPAAFAHNLLKTYNL